MAEDFKASQVQTNKVIVTGSFAGGSANQVLVYPITAEDSGSPNQGAIDSSVFDTSVVGSDVLLFVSGGIGERGTADAGSVSVFGGDLHISGNLTIDGSGGGGGATSGTFNVPSPAEFVTTASVSIAGGEGFSYTADSVGTDVYFFVSGSEDSKNGATAGTAVFGGDVVVSGTLYAEKQVIEVDEFTTGSLLVSGNLIVSQSADIKQGLNVNTSREGYGITVYGDGSSSTAFFLSGSGGASSPDESQYTDVAFFVSGSLGSKDGATPGVALFGGDVVISGTLHGGSPLKIGTNTQITGAVSQDATGYTTTGVPALPNFGSYSAAYALEATDETQGLVVHDINGNGSWGLLSVGQLTLENLNSNPSVAGATPDAGSSTTPAGLDVSSGGGSAGLAAVGPEAGSSLTLRGGSGGSGDAGGSGSGLNSADGGSVTLTGGSAGVLRTGGTVAGAGGSVSVTGASGRNGNATAAGGSGGSVSIDAGSGGSDGGAGAGTPGLVNIGLTNASTVKIGTDLQVTGSIFATQGLSGSLTTLEDGTSYLIAGSNVTITTGSSGAVTISSTGGGGGGATSGTFNVPSPAEFVTTASVSIAGGEGFAYTADSVGTDTYFFVSGSRSRLGGSKSSVSTFGGDIVTSGSVYVGGTGGSADLQVRGNVEITGSLAHPTDNQATGTGAHAEGRVTTASGVYSHAEGQFATSEGGFSHAEGRSTTSRGQWSHAEGQSTVTEGSYSHAEGLGTIASGSHQHVQGKYNLRGNTTSLMVIGDGTADADISRGDIVRVNPGVSIGTGRVEVTGTLASTLGLSGSLTKLVDGTSYLIAGSNVTITSASNGAVTIASTAGGGGGATTGTFNVPSPAEFVTTASVSVAGGQGFSYTADSVGTDTYFFVSGSQGSKDGAIAGAAVFGGDVIISGTLHGGSPLKIGSDIQITGSIFATQGLTGSLTKLEDGSAYLRAGSNINVSTGSDGAVTVSYVGNPEINDPEYFYANTTDNLTWTSTTWSDVTNVATGLTDQRKSGNISRSGSTFTVNQAGKYYWRSDFNIYSAVGASYVGFRLSGSNGTLAQHTVYVTDSASADAKETRGIINTVVDLQAGESFDFEYAVSAATAAWTSSTLDGESTVSGDIAMFRIPGSNTATSGTFNVPSPAEFVTTASVSIAGGEGFLYTADSVGTDAYFFVSGSQGSKDGATAGTAVFGGDTVVSGNLTSIGNFEVGEISETLGTDVGMFVSGIIGSKDGSQAGTALFGGDVSVSGTLFSEQGLSGSLTKLTDGTSYLIAGSNVTITTGSSGAVTISTAGGGGLSTGKQYVAPYTSFSTTSTTAAGQFSWFPADFSGLTSVTLRAIMSTDGTANLTGSLQMFNFTSGTYVDLVDTPATSKHMIITASTPTAVTSSNLLTGETAFGNLVDSVYEIRVSGSSANQVVLGGVELVFS